MIDFDKIINFKCPNECGQISVSCSLSLILNNESFFCEACGYRFQASEFPHWLSQAVSENTDEDGALQDMMQKLYTYLYANGPCPAKYIISQLLQANLNLWKLFPLKKISISDILKLLDDKEFLQVFDFSSLDNTQIIKLLIHRPDLGDKCDLNKLTAEDWLKLIVKQPQFAKNCPWENLISECTDENTSSKITPENSEKIFHFFPYKNDSRFQQKTANAFTESKEEFPGSLEDFFAIVNYLDFYQYIDWKKFSADDLLPFIKKYHCIVLHYPFNDDNLKDFDWNYFPLSFWESIKSEIYIPSALIPVYDLRTGKNVSEILKKDSELYKFCNWNKMSSSQWANLLIAFPENKIFRDNCDWKELRQSAWDKILDDGTNSYAIAVYSVLQGEKIDSALKKYPDIKKYVAWEKIEISKWLELLAEDLQLAVHCPWGKMYEYIKQLPAAESNSVKTHCLKLWKKREELWDVISNSKLKRLSKDKYYTILKFFDLGNKIDFSVIPSDKRMEIFNMFPQFAEEYGWKNFTEEEIESFLNAHPDHLHCFEKIPSFKKMLRQLANTNEKIADRYHLDWRDYLFFRKFNSTKLCSKITFSWHFTISIATLFGIFLNDLVDGPCGLKALYAEFPVFACFAIVIYIVIAFSWSYIHAKLFSGRTPFLLTIISALAGAALIFLQYKYTFFLTKISWQNYTCFGILSVVIFSLFAAKAGKAEMFSKNKKGIFSLCFLYYPIACLMNALCQPQYHSDFLKLHEQIKNSSKPFKSAADYYLTEAFKSDTKTQELIADLEKSLLNDSYHICRVKFDKIPRIYSDLDAIKKLKNKVVMKNIRILYKKNNRSR